MQIMMWMSGHLVGASVMKKHKGYEGPVEMWMVWGGQYVPVVMDSDIVSRNILTPNKHPDTNVTVAWSGKSHGRRIS